MQSLRNIVLVLRDICNPLKITCKIWCLSISFWRERLHLSSDPQKNADKIKNHLHKSSSFQSVASKYLCWSLRCFLGVWEVKTIYKIILRWFYLFVIRTLISTCFHNIMWLVIWQLYSWCSWYKAMVGETADILAWTKMVAQHVSAFLIRLVW